MPEIDPVILQLRADVAKYNSNIAGAQRLTDQKLAAIERRGFQMGQSLQRGFSMATKAALQFAAGFGAVQLARELLSLADKAKTLDASLRLATKETGSFAVATADVNRIARETRANLNETATLYASFARNAGELGINQAQVAAITKTVNQAFTVSGTTAADAANATRQLSQAFASGVLRGDEFNSIMENAPRLAKLLADSMGVPVGALRAMAEEGELTADRLTRALSDQKFTEGLQAEFDQMPVTFDQAMTLVYNAAQTTFAEFDRGGQFSQMLANFVTDGSDGFRDLGDAAFDFGARVRAAFAGLSAVARGFHDELVNIGNQLGINASILSGVNWAGLALGPMGPLLPTDPLARLSPNYREGRDASLGEAALRKVMGGDPFADFPGLRRGGTATPRRATAATGKKAGKKGPAATRSPLDPDAFAREEAQLNAEILGLKADQVTDVAQQASLELQRLKTLQDREAAETLSNKRMTASEQERAVALQATVYALRGAAVVAERDKELLEQAKTAQEKATDAQRENLRYELDALGAQAENARTRQDRLAVERSILDLLEKQEQAELDALILARKILDPVAAQNALNASQAGRRQGMARDHESPFQRYMSDLADEALNVGDAFEEAAVRGIERINQGLADSVKNALGLHGVLGDIIGDFIEIALRQAMIGSGGGGGILGTIGSLLGLGAKAIGGNTAGLESNFDAIFGGRRASGGPVDAGRAYLVGEGGGRPELFVPRSAGTIIPNQRLASGAGGAQGIATVRLELSGDIDARIQSISGPVAVEVVRASAPTLIDASAREAMARAGRPRM